MKSFLILTVLFCIAVVFDQSMATDIYQNKLFPFGAIHGDDTLNRSDDTISEPIQIPISFPFFNHKYDEIKIQINGMILFGNELYGNLSYTPSPFPVDGIVCIAPFWADGQTNDDVDSNIFYRQIEDQPTLNKLDHIVKNAFPKQTTHRLSWAFIVTWHDVPGYGMPSSFRNTFQAIITTNGINSFAIYNYDKLQWTSGSVSHSIHAQAGFNAGDMKNYFLINKSFTSQVVDLVNDSNVQFPGRFLFSIGADIVDVVCNKSTGLQVTPSRGSSNGGYEIRLYGICFKERNYIIKIDHHRLTDCNVTSTYVTCMMPMIYNGPTIQIQVLTIKEVSVATTRFLIDIPPDNSELLIKSSNIQNSFTELTPDNLIILRFKNNFITKNYLFRVELFHYETIFSENYELVSIVPRQRVLYSSANLSSLETLTIQYNDLFELNNTRAIADDIKITMLKVRFKVLPAATIKSTPLTWLNRAVEWTVNAVKETSDFCAKWEAKLPEMPAPFTYQSRIPQCPCRVPANGLNRFPLTFNNFQSDPSCNNHKAVTCTYSTHVAHCYRRSFEPVGPGVKCCYDTNGMIIKNPQLGAGGLEVETKSDGSILQQIKHALVDQLSFWSCCELPQMITHTRPDSCNRYHQQRPLFECENIPLPVPSGGSGDPHFTTLDGADYTFNGYGEYVLLRTHTLPNSMSLEIQIRTKSVQSDTEDNHATAIVGFVIKNGNYSKVQFELFQKLKLLEIRLNDESIDSDTFFNPSMTDNDNDEIYQILMAMTPTIQFDDNQISITQTNRTTYSITYSNNVQLIIKIREQYDFLNVVTILPEFYQRYCQGLLGNMDGDKNNDFTFQDNQKNLSLDEQQNEEDLFDFGESWRVTSETTLFVYTAGENYHTHQNLGYRPIMREELFRRYQNTPRLKMAQQNCEKILSENGKEACIYDILITNDKTLSELNQDFRTNMDEWKEYAALVQKDNSTNMGLMLRTNINVMCNVIIITSIRIMMYWHWK